MQVPWYQGILRPPPQWWGLDLDSRNSGCARLGGEVGPPLGVVVEKVAVLVVLVRRHRHAVRAAVRRAVDDEVPGDQGGDGPILLYVPEIFFCEHYTYALTC